MQVQPNQGTKVDLFYASALFIFHVAIFKMKKMLYNIKLIISIYLTAVALLKVPL